METCPICFNNKKLIKTTCEHKFCRKCLKKWFSRGNVTCPMCRTTLNRNIGNKVKLQHKTFKFEIEGYLQDIIKSTSYSKYYVLDKLESNPRWVKSSYHYFWTNLWEIKRT